VGCLLAVKGKSLGQGYQLALFASHILFASSSILLLVLWLTGSLDRPAVPLVYSLVALLVIPCVAHYLPEDEPRDHTLCIAVSCLFASGMVFRAWQTL
jgi:hypothetical protein